MFYKPVGIANLSLTLAILRYERGRFQHRPARPGVRNMLRSRSYPLGIAHEDLLAPTQGLWHVLTASHQQCAPQGTSGEPLPYSRMRF